MVRKWAEEILAAARDVTDRDVSLAPSGCGHIRLRIETDNGTRTLFVASTPSDWRTLRNMQRDLRALLNK